MKNAFDRVQALKRAWGIEENLLEDFQDDTFDDLEEEILQWCQRSDREAN